MDRLNVRVGALALKNPLICGSAEHLMEEAGIRRALAAGAGAVVIKSTNESEAAREQLARTDYALLDSTWRRLPWSGAPPRDAGLFCRSGLSERRFEEWLELAIRMDRLAASYDAYLVASLVLADLEPAIAFARQIEAAGIRILELNIGAPHGDEAAPGAIRLIRSTEAVADVTARLRSAVSIPLWIKLTGRSDDLPALAQAARTAGADAVTLMGRFMAFVPDLDTMTPLLGTHAAYGGPWALPLTCHWLVKTRQRVGPAFPVMATNGARNGLDIARFLLSGAHAVQMASAILVGGFAVVEQALEALHGYLERRQTTAAAIIGLAADRAGTYAAQPLRPGYWRQFAPHDSLD